jgi:hypothetical protein
MAAAAVNAKTAPSDAPAGTTAQCKDGTWFSGAEKKGACSGHKGIKEWYGAADDKGAKAAPAKTDAAKSDATKTDTAKTATPPPASEKEAAKTDSKRKAPPKPEDIAAKPGGGPGLVWVNESSKVYHCQGDKWYGKTKQGEYMSEADAKVKGFKGDHGKSCSKS